MISLAALLALQAAPAPVADTTDYFQQDVDYTLEARLDEDRDVLIGAGVMEYQNNSQQALDTLYFHLYLNAFRPNSVWAQTEKREDYDFQDLAPIDAGFHHMQAMSVDG